MRRFLLLLLLCPFADASVLRYTLRASDSSGDPTARVPYYYVATTTSELTSVTGMQKGDFGFSKSSNLLYFFDGSSWVSTGGGGGGAPTTATYLTQTADAGLSAEQAMGALGTGLVKNTTTSGVQSIYAGSTCGAGTKATSTDASGVLTCSAVSLTADVSGDLPFSSLVQSSAASKLVGRGSASGAGDFQEITLGTNLSLSGTTLNASGGGSTPTGTGYRHVTAGAEDAASKLVNLTASTDVAANQGTTTTVFHGNAAGQGSFSAIVDADVTSIAGGKVSSAVAMATALATNPADCAANQYANTIAANGDLTCTQVAYSQVSGTPTIPTDLSAEPFVTAAASGNLSAERVLSNGTNTTIDTGTAGQIKVNLSGTIAEGTITNLTTDLAAKAPTTRAINTTAPVTGGGDLSADRTIAVSDFVASGASHARGTVPDPGASAGTTRFLREDATFAVPAGGGGSANVVSVDVDFGATGNTSAAAVVTGQAWVTGTSKIICAPTMFATSSRGDGADDAIIEGLTVGVFGRVAGTGFTVKASAQQGEAYGVYTINCLGV